MKMGLSSVPGYEAKSPLRIHLVRGDVQPYGTDLAQCTPSSNCPCRLEWHHLYQDARIVKIKINGQHPLPLSM